MTIDRSALTPGHRLPAFTRTPSFHHWNRYAAVNSEFVDIHMDDSAGQAAGYSGAIGMGNLTIAWFHAMLEDWLGTDGRVTSFAGQFRSPALKGDDITCNATVTDVTTQDNGTTLVSLELAATNQRDEAMMPGTAVVELF
jgi:acyl dehydratase